MSIETHETLKLNTALFFVSYRQSWIEIRKNQMGWNNVLVTRQFKDSAG